jgi:D-alanine-D-alanine ligase
VSIASGLRIIDALRAHGHSVTAVDPVSGVVDAGAEDKLRRAGMGTAPPPMAQLARMARASLAPVMMLPAVREADVVFIGLHGGQGEDGTIQAMLDAAGVSYTGSGHLASALAMDKDLSKALFRAAGVATADWMMAPPSPDAGAVERKLGWPVVVKPSKQGSTVGLTVVREPRGLAAAIDEAARYDDEVMIERFVPGRELTVGVLGSEALAVGEIIPKHEIYDYECKYTAGMAREEFPARLSPADTAAVRQLSLKAFAALKLSGYARIDFRMPAGGEFFCLEANTLPGMTELSLIPQSAAACGVSFDELCERIVRLAVHEGGKT